MRRTSRRSLHWESLESRALLSGAQTHLHSQAHRHLLESRTAVVSSQVTTSGSGAVTGSIAGLNVGTALSDNDTQALEQVASTNNLEMFLTQLALLSDSRTDVQQNAQMLLN